MTVADRIDRKLRDAFAPSRLEVVDESHLHVGHPGAQPGGETHFRIEIAATAFEAMPRVERQRRVYAVLAEELRDRVHALSLRALTPQEDQRPSTRQS